MICRLSLSISLLISSLNILAQHGYKTGESVQNIQIKTILNSTITEPSLDKLKGKLTIIDFFGTWCIPCMKALPHLETISKKYPDVSILLVSNETEDRIRKFLIKRSDITLPLIIDKEDIFTKLFQPPSYPYSVILGEDGKIITTLQAAELDELQVEKWLKGQNKLHVMKPNQQNTPINSTNQIPHPSKQPSLISATKKLIQLSQDFVYAAKTGENVVDLKNSLAAIRLKDLQQELVTDDERKAFWINLYNGFTQILLKQDPGKYKTRKIFFTSKQIKVAGIDWSLDEIEHGLLRHSKIKWSLGYLGKLFPSKLERSLRVSKLDFRIHFSLNCGAKSCPPIAFYVPSTLNGQLDMATKAYLSTETEYDSILNEIKLPAILGWFRGDFGGRRGMLRILKNTGLVSKDKFPHISFKKYDWTLYLDNYKTNS